MRNQIAKRYANHCRHNYRKHRPAHTTRFFFDCKAGCGAREVEDAHYYCTDCRCKRPAVLRKQCKKFLITCKISQRTRGKVRHNYYRYDGFISGKAEYKSHYNYSVKTYGSAERVKKSVQYESSELSAI